MKKRNFIIIAFIAIINITLNMSIGNELSGLASFKNRSVSK